MIDGDIGLALDDAPSEKWAGEGEAGPGDWLCKAAIWLVEYIDAMVVGEADMNWDAAMDEAP